MTEPETVSEAAVSKTEESATQTDADEEETKSPEYTQSVDDQIAVQAANGWQLDAAGNYTYVQNGQIVKNCIMQMERRNEKCVNQRWHIPSMKLQSVLV